MVKPEQLMEAVQHLANRLRRGSPMAMGLAKNFLNQSFETNQKAASEFEAYVEAVCIDSQFHHRAVKAFWKRVRRHTTGTSMENSEGAI